MRENILLKKAKFNYPIYKVKAEFIYRKEIKPSAYHRLWMTIVKKYPNVTVKDLEEELSLDSILLSRVVEDLENTGLITTTDDGAYLLTSEGRELYEKEKILSRLYSLEEEYDFDPLRQQLVGHHKQSSEDGFSLQKFFEYSKSDVEPCLEEKFNEIKEVDWRLDDIEHQNSDSSLIKYVEAKLELDSNNKHLHVSSDEPEFHNWFEESQYAVKKEILDLILEAAKETVNQSSLHIDWQSKDKNYLSLQVADGEINIQEHLEKGVEVKFAETSNSKHSGLPIIEYSPNITKASLKQEKCLVVPWRLVPKNLLDFKGVNKKSYYDFSNKEIFIEKEGILKCYFQAQPYKLPVRVLYKEAELDLMDSLMKESDMDILIFMSNYLDPTKILDKLPEPMNMGDIRDFIEGVKSFWGKDCRSWNWLSREMDLLKTEEDIACFKKYFPKADLSIKRISEDFHKELFHCKSIIGEISELQNIYRLFEKLCKCGSDILNLQEVNCQRLHDIDEWRKAWCELKATFPRVVDNEELVKLNQDLDSWDKKRKQLFELPSEKKVAVLDTNLLRKFTEDRLKDLQRDGYQIIVPTAVISELDAQKKRYAKEHDECKQKLAECKSDHDDKAQKEIDFRENKISELENLIEEKTKELDGIQNSLKKEKSKKNKQVKDLKGEIGKLKNDKKNIEEEVEKKLCDLEHRYHRKQEGLTQKLNDVKEHQFQVRSAMRLLDVVKGVRIEETPEEILNLLKERSQDGDDKILAVAAKYKLVNVKLCSKDKNLCNRAYGLNIEVMTE